LLEFRNIKRASKAAYNHRKWKRSDETLDLKFQHSKEEEQKLKTTEFPHGFSDFSLHLRLHPCMVYIRASTVEIIPAFHVLKGRICSNYTFEMIKRNQI